MNNTFYNNIYGIILFPLEYKYNWRMNMKKIFLTLITISTFILMAETKTEKIKEDDFLRAKPYIENEDLRNEIDNLRKEFEHEKKLLHETYKEKMEKLKLERQNEMKSLKIDFASRRELLFKTYPPKKRKKPLLTDPNNKIKGKSDAKKRQKNKPKMQKP